MKKSRAGRRTAFARVLSAFTAALVLALSAATAFAGTTGVISGVVTDAQSHSPIANVQVAAAAPTGRYTAKTDAHGFYSMAGVYADSYTVSFQIQGYEPQSIPGVTVFADQSQTV
ncbi:MAG: carboxypeptidase regulatory-like domain-containing protein, partial [Candidatus Eremiobacteraeota bacterium]|nr:carboxypeptidase regulatory-like domain-containing protein [Candidatus Eremiobacteraeota bacterium]